MVAFFIFLIITSGFLALCFLNYLITNIDKEVQELINRHARLDFEISILRTKLKKLTGTNDV